MSTSSSEKLIEPILATFYRQKLATQQYLIGRGEALVQNYLASASAFRSLMIDVDFCTVLKAEGILTMPGQSKFSNPHMRVCGSATADSNRMLSNGLSLEQISECLPTDFRIIRRDGGDRTGLCTEAIFILKTHAVTPSSCLLLQRMKPQRQVEVAEQMVASSMCCPGLIRYLLYATKPDLLVEGFQERKNRHWSDTATQRFARESGTLLRDVRSLRPDRGEEALYATLFRAYIIRILTNTRVRSYLERKRADLLGLLQWGYLQTSSASPAAKLLMTATVRQGSRS